MEGQKQYIGHIVDVRAAAEGVEAVCHRAQIPEVALAERNTGKSTRRVSILALHPLVCSEGLRRWLALRPSRRRWRPRREPWTAGGAV